jgi:polyketide-type polyunsaturated fatty acid synthase PfaA
MLARSRGQAMAAPEDSAFAAGKMAAVVGDPAKVAADLEGIKDVSIANYNSNNQVVIAGTSSQIEVAIGELKGKGYKVVPLPVSAAFHTPLVGHAQKPFAKAIDSAKFNAPTIPVFSNSTGKAHSTKPSEIKKSLKKHILESVHFNQEIDNIYADGGRVFIEFGPKNVLTKLVENILSDKDDVVAIAVNANPKKPSDVQMRQAALQMAVLGLSLDSIDQYDAVKRPLTAPKSSPMLMKLSAASYVSPKTKKAFEDALTDGWTVKQAKAVAVEPQIKIVEKIVEVEKIVQVEKIVYVQADGAQAPANSGSNDSNGDLVASIERSVGQFVEHQQQLLNVHEQFMQGPQDYAKTFQNVLAAQSGQALPESLDRTLAMYNQFQSETLRVHETYLNNQTDSMSTLLSGNANESVVAPAPVKTIAAPAPIAQGRVQAVAQTTPVVAIANTAVAVAQSAPVAAPVQAVAAAPVAVPMVKAAPVVQAAPVVVSVAAPVAAPSVDVATINKVMLEVVADKTGYPTDMLELGMDMEADLGIDSIKRVEILGAVQELIPDLPELNPEDLAELRTLGEIVDYMKSKAASVAPASAQTSAAPAVDLGHIQNVMMEVVADKTGYPTDML